VKQSISGPAAAAIIVAVLVGSLLIFNRAQLAPAPEPPRMLPPSPPVDETELSRLRRGLSPLGISVVWPPLAEDRLKVIRIAWAVPGSPAQTAGLRGGDALQSFNDIETTHPYRLAAALADVDPEKAYEAVIVRAGEQQTLLITGIRPLLPEERVF
jgi:membrane-associated protease RseP (regulator of RpoE activity)